MKKYDAWYFLLLITCCIYYCTTFQKNASNRYSVTARSYIKISGLQFKDLNRNGKLDKYEDWRLSNEERSKDLLSKMSVEEKVGFMLISTQA
jgi:beta-glucosidase